MHSLFLILGRVCACVHMLNAGAFRVQKRLNDLEWSFMWLQANQSWYLELNACPLREQYVLLVNELSLWPPVKLCQVFYWFWEISYKVVTFAKHFHMHRVVGPPLLPPPPPDPWCLPAGLFLVPSSPFCFHHMCILVSSSLCFLLHVLLSSVMTYSSRTYTLNSKLEPA